MKTIVPNQKHENFHNDIKKVIHDHLMKNQSAMERQAMLAILSKWVGILIAIQDQRVLTKSQIFEMINANIETGNQEYILGIMGPLDPPSGTLKN